MSRPLFILIVLLELFAFGGRASLAGEIEYPQIIKTRYEASDPKMGGQFVLWSERERIFYGLDPKLFPAAQFVVTGVLGPHSNAHGPNEFLDIPTAKKVAACIADVLADHAAQA